MVRVLNVRLKSSKTSSVGNRGEIVQVYETGGRYCPLAAVDKYMELNKKGKNPECTMCVPQFSLSIGTVKTILKQKMMT